MSAFGVPIEESQIVIIRGGATKHDALDALIDAVCRNPAITDKEVFRRAVHDREAVMSTGIGNGIAIPHVRIPEVTTATLGVGIAPKGVEFGAIDNKPVHILVLFATPKGADKEYLKLLAQVMLRLRDQTFFKQLIECRSPVQAYAILNA